MIKRELLILLACITFTALVGFIVNAYNNDVIDLFYSTIIIFCIFLFRKILEIKEENSKV